jgi:flagellar motor switch protein FliM
MAKAAQGQRGKEGGSDDPLGRSRGENGNDVKIPGAADLARAREIARLEGAIAFQSLQQSLEETSAQLQLANMQVDVDRSRVRMLNRTAEITIEVAARLRAAELSSTKLSGLKEGDILHLGVRADEPLTLWVGERATHQVTAGKRGRKTAVEISSPMLLDEMAFTDTLRG